MERTFHIHIVDDVSGSNGEKRRAALMTRACATKRIVEARSCEVKDFRSFGQWKRYVQSLKEATESTPTHSIWLVFVHGRMLDIDSFFEFFRNEVVESYGADYSNVVTYTGLQEGNLPVLLDGSDAHPGKPSWWLAHLNRVYHGGDVTSINSIGDIAVADWVDEALRRSSEGPRTPRHGERKDRAKTRLRTGKSGKPKEKQLPRPRSKAKGLEEDVTDVTEHAAKGSSKVSNVRDARHILNNAIVPFSINLSRALETRDEILPDFQLHLVALQHALDDSHDLLPEYLCGEVKTLQVRAQEFDRTPQSGRLVLETLTALSTALNGLCETLVPDSRVLSNIKRTLKGRSVRVLWVEDDPGWTASFGELLIECGIALDYVREPAAFARYKGRLKEYDAVLLDLTLFGWIDFVHKALEAEQLPFADITETNAGVGLLRLIRAANVWPPVYVLSAHQSSELVVACIHEGANDYFTKGALDISRLTLALHRDINSVIEAQKAHKRPLNPDLFVGGDHDPLEAELARISELRWELIRQPVYLWGEPGVGKEEFAIELQKRSHRERLPFKVLPCSEIVETLAESAVKGHSRGAFTGAVDNLEGPLEEAKNGVLFVDEIDKAPERVLDVLLRPLEARQVSKIGSRKMAQIEALVIFAGNRPPQDLRNQSFSSRLGPIYRIPTLKERISALSGLAQFLVDRLCRELGRSQAVLKPDALDWLRNAVNVGQFDGEGGNIRGLRNLLLETLCLQSVDESVGARELQRVARHRVTGHMSEPRLEHVLLKAAAGVADFLTHTNQAVFHKDLEDQFMSAVFLILKQRHVKPADTLRLLFENLDRTNLSNKVKSLREKGFLPDDFTYGGRQR